MMENSKDKFEGDIKKSLDKIVPQDNAKERMYENILAKAAKKEKKHSKCGSGSMLKFALPVAACVCVVAGYSAYNIGKNNANFGNDKGYYGESSADYTEGVVMGGSPFSDVDDAQEFHSIGIDIDAPDGAEDVSYSIIDGSIASISFIVDGHNYIFRASYQSGDFTGLYGEEKTSKIIDAKNTARLYVIEDSLGRSYKVYWTDGSINFYLINSDGADEDDVRGVAAELIAR